jgi:predicted nucleic acid-binding protein
MSVRSFLDSNVLVYTDDATAGGKQAAALDLVRRCRREGCGVVSTQVLQEYFVVSTRKLGVADEIARRKVELFARFDLVLNQVDDILAAIDLRRLHGLSFWDGLIVRAALRSGSRILYSEDLQAGRRIDGLEIVNPFS